MADISAAVEDIKDGITDASKRVAAALPLWVIIVIVVVGTGLLALLVGLCCLCLCRRRRRRRVVAGGDTTVHGYSDMTAAAPPSEAGGSRSSEEGGGPGGRHKLRKRPPSSASSSSSFGNDRDGVTVTVDDRGVEVEEVEVGRGEPEFRNMAMAPARKAGLLAMPPLLTGLRASIVSMGGGGRRSAGRGESGGLNISHDGATNSNNWHRRRTSEAWIDDDALHGPEVSPTKRSSAAARRSRTRRRSRIKSWGASIRESWPLKTPSPTLPLLPHFGSFTGGQGADAGHESFAMFQYGKDCDADDAAGDSFVPNLPPPLGAAARQRNGQLSPPRQLPKPPSQALLAANASTAGLRPVSNLPGVATASNSPRGRGLSYYKYEDTDQPVKHSGSPSPRSRVQRGAGVGTGVVGPRGRAAPSADSTMTQILKDTEKRLQDGVATGVAMRNRPSSSPPKRPPPPPLGLGPGAVTVALVRSRSRSRTPSPAKASGRAHGVAPSHARQGSQASFASEPDSLFGDPSPPSSLPYHGLTSPSRSKPSQQSSPHRRRPSLVPSFTSSASSLSTIHSETEEAITPNTTAPNSSIPFGMNQIDGLGDPFMPSKNSTPASKKAPGSVGRDPGERSDSPLSPVTGNMRSPDATPTRGGNRNVAATPISGLSPTKVSDKGTPVPLFKRLSDLAPPFRSRDETPGVVRPSPALRNANARLSSVYDFYADMPESSGQQKNSHNLNTDPTNNRRRAGGGQARMVSSSAASVSSSLYSDTSAAERERERQNAALSRISMLLNQEIGQQRDPSGGQPKPTMRVPSQNYHGGDARVSATVAAVAELRRMNSQVSAYSTAAASAYSDTSSLAAAANIRPESVVPPRGGAAAARNYLALGSPVKSSPDREVRGRYELGYGEEEGDDAVTPTRNNNRRVLGVSSESGSEDGVSLYDQDGFYITPARRHGLRS
ncbi:hypothetical protein KVR01_006575 [Diaporthe batatas]|uniref:uncharacterized protein n=1 Tax=Diaporthe batatas TaxID=748121 RepID=UPI001D0543ED|nr:uncharacterized protein KVR01_006575 [Diaporthe batatas]KAG8163278.1 hypothetical protein KVR01_006575 [Diaporthe batatas]